MTKINISIPQPCHENWEAMNPESKGRFCDSCQKKVFDFTHSSDREIVNAFKQNENLCGRFLNTQLNRDLIKPENKSSLWLAATTTLVSLIGLNEVTAQETIKTEQTDTRVLLGKPAPPKENIDSIKKGELVVNPEIEVSGIVTDRIGPLPGVNILIKGTKKGTQTDFNGNFSIKATENDILVFSFIGAKEEEITVKNSTDTLEVKVMMEEYAMGEIARKRTFLGRIFHSIGNWFR